MKSREVADSVVEVGELENGNRLLKPWSGKEKGWGELQGRRSSKCIKER